MVWPNTSLTILVGAAFGGLIWKPLPAAWTAMQIAGLCLLAAGFVL